ncbi:MAG: M28 family peptidase [Clostridia bacterium]|nr:M28 family peptidase [Clostridia bacterium]
MKVTDYKSTYKAKLTSLILMLSLLLSVFCSCGDDETEKVLPADFGTYGADFARLIADKHSYRGAYSTDEAATGIMIKDEFEALGYTVTSQVFSGSSGQPSYNYYVKIEGKGFKDVDSKGVATDVRRSVIVGAHYDTAFSSGDKDDSYSFDGISDNASGIGCLMTVAKNIKDYDLDFDVYLVAFGAESDNQAGSRFFYSQLTSDIRNSIEVMFCIDSIYAGDKVYASSGFNSLDLSQKYSMRRKLYQAYDVAYDYMLGSINGFYLYYNECGIITDLNGDGVDDVYREVTTVKSDYVVFDEANIPVVFFDSGDYFFQDMDDFKETKNLHLQEFDGKISKTYLDSSEILDDVLNKNDVDRLELRINNVAFVIMETIMKGSDHALTLTEYQELLKTPTEEVTSTEVSTSSTSLAG